MAEYLIQFYKGEELASSIRGEIGDHWNYIYDLLFVSDFMRLCPIAFKEETAGVFPCPFDDVREVEEAEKLLVEDMACEGYSLIFHLHEGWLYVRPDRGAITFGKEALQQYSAFLPQDKVKDLFFVCEDCGGFLYTEPVPPEQARYAGEEGFRCIKCGKFFVEDEVMEE